MEKLYGRRARLYVQINGPTAVFILAYWPSLRRDFKFRIAFGWKRVAKH